MNEPLRREHMDLCKERAWNSTVFFVDASGNTKADTHAIGIVICLHGHRVWANASTVLPFQTTTLDAEMIAICRAVLLADCLGILDVCIRSDCKAAVSQFQGSPPRRSSGMEIWRRASRSARSRGRNFRLECIDRRGNLAHPVAYQLAHPVAYQLAHPVAYQEVCERTIMQ